MNSIPALAFAKRGIPKERWGPSAYEHYNTKEKDK